MVILIFRTMILFLSLLLFYRLLGKRQLGELELSELTVSMLIADISAIPLQDIGIPLINALVPMVVLFALELLLSVLTESSVRLRGLLWGKPCFLIEQGKINQREMRRCHFTPDELTQELRRQSVVDLNTVEYAILETDGTLSVLLTPPNRAPSAAQLGVVSESVGYTTTIIEQGRILGDNLHKCGRDKRWLHRELHRQGFRDAKEVYFMTVNAAGQVYIAGKEQK